MPRKVVLAVDPSPVSLDTLKWATKSLLNKNDELHLISVLESGLPNDVVGESAADTTASADCKPDPIALQRRQDLLQQCKKEAEGEGLANVKMTTLVSCVGGSADMGRHITEFAECEKADLLVVGSRGMGGFKRALYAAVGLGSVSNYITANSTVNVVVHKSPMGGQNGR